MQLNIETASLAETIERFTSACLKGKSELQKINLYHNLIRNNIEDTLRKGYPLTRGLLTDEEWNTLVQGFLLEKESPSPFLWKMPYAFLQFVKKKRFGKEWKLPYLNDLLHFEWIEILLFMQKDIPLRKKSPPGTLYLNPESKLLCYHYPVFQRISRIDPPKKGIYWVLGYRHPVGKQVHFVSLSPFFAALLIQLKNPVDAKEALLETAAQFSLKDADAVLKAGGQFLADLHSQGGLL